MVLRKSLISFAALSMCTTSPLAAFDETKLLKVIGTGWALYEVSDGRECRLLAIFENDQFLALDYVPRYKSFYVIVGQDGWSITRGKEYKVRVTFDDDEYWEDKEALGMASEESGMLQMYFDQEFGLAMMKSTNLEVTWGDAVLGRFELTKSSEAIPQLVKCAEKRYWENPGDPFANSDLPSNPPISTSGATATKSQPATMISGMPSLSDYPSEALAKNMEGRVSIRLDIDKFGTANSCAVLSSSGHSLLDKASCDAVLRRGKFGAATDNEGNAIAGQIVFSVPWELPK